ncbi:MAG TPA: GTPase [Candidatus Aminicenantes bacterium]|nr:GTPase [Candidatus Aminicenantes bacterium]
MAFVNYNNKEITVKIVYYGPALSGKTTCLRYIYASRSLKKKGKLITLDTDGDRTLFFDFLPLEIGKLGEYTVKIQLYTVPGQVAYDTTRKLVLQGADGIVFVADSQVAVREQNIASYKNMKRNLALNNISYSEIPIILQYNKRDLHEILPVDELNSDLNGDNKPFSPTVATSGEKIIESLHTIMRLVVISLKNRLSVFQKDKTVMFSRDEITTSSPESPEPIEKISGKASEMEAGDTEAEDIFELDSPIEELESAEEEEAIFDLGDESVLTPGEAEAIEVPDFDHQADSTSPPLADAHKPGGQDSTDYWEEKENSDIHIRLDDSAGKVVIPVTLVVPKGHDKTQVDIQLSVTIQSED